MPFCPVRVTVIQRPQESSTESQDLNPAETCTAEEALSYFDQVCADNFNWIHSFISASEMDFETEITEN
jgi:hypothetical protein